MPRPKKCRRVCALPQNTAFLPADGSGKKQPVILTVDEYETIRLIDREGFSQEECGGYMKIARTSVQQIYASARKKVADALVDGLPLRIEGGDYRLCNGEEAFGRCAGCQKRRNAVRMQKQKSAKGAANMKIAVTYENGQIFQHFGHTEQFKVYTVEQGKITDATVVDTNGSGHGALAGFLRTLQVEALICGGIGGGARNALAAAGIELYGGVSGDADQAVAALLSGGLSFTTNATCNHHGETHSHTCGDHGCGTHHCGE